MTSRRLLVHSIFVFLLPIVVAAFGVSLAGSIALVVVMLVWRWLISLSGLVAPEQTPELQLDTIPPSHFAEKVRWCMDRLGLDYTEVQVAGTLGVWFTGRTVPRLRVRTGAVRSSIGNSPEILRYLWGRYSPGNETADFLEPTPRRIELEHGLDRYGRNLQVWIYYHLPSDRELTLRLWGANSPLVPGWQRLALRIFYPVSVFLIRRSFRVSAHSCERAVQRIEALLARIDTKLADGRPSILGEDEVNYTDMAFAALSGPWLMPAGYGGKTAEHVLVDRERMPADMRRDVERWIEDYPKAVAFVENMYATERLRQT